MLAPVPMVGRPPPGSTAAPVRYFEIELENVLVAEIAAGEDEGSLMSEFV